jgi:hypothetical protein
MKIYKNGLWVALFVVSFVSFGLGSARASEDFKVIIKNHQFEPPELVVPSEKKIQILVENQDPSKEKFYSYDLHREKVISGNDKITLFVGPLKPGSYKYQGYYNPKTAQGTIVAKD